MMNRIGMPGGLVLAMVVVAGCSSSAGSSGAIQDDASGSFAPSSSFAPSPSQPPASMAAEVASPTPTAGMPSSELASQAPSQEAPGAFNRPPNTGDEVCDSGLQYACGDAGPNGGTVFYASATPFPCGANLASSCNFMEVAPNGWNGKEVNCKNGCGGSVNKTSDFGSASIGTGNGYVWCLNGTQIPPTINGAAGQDIGTGYSNTMAMVSSCGSNPASAGVLAYNYGANTWFLPSLYEAIALYNYTGRNQIGGFAAYEYWTSTAVQQGSSYVVDFGSGDYDSLSTTGYLRGVRPISAF